MRPRFGLRTILGMCRWLAYSGDPIPLEALIVQRKYSLIDQSLHSRLGATTTNGDGFGVGWYDGVRPEPAVYRRVNPAWNDRNLRELAAPVFSLFFAHIRASTGTAVQETNTHPFRHGRWLFMHNGLVREFARVRRDLVMAIDPELFPAMEGSADSEVLFLLALTFGLDDDAYGAIERMAGFVEDVGEAHGVEHPLQMTVAASDGVRIIAALYPENERLRHLSDEARAVVSEPLGDLEGAWNEVPESSIGMVRPGDDDLRPFTPRRGAKTAA